MATITTTQSFTTGDQVTAGTLNGIATNSAFDTSVVDDSSTVLTTNASGTANSRIIVKDGGITPAKLSTGGPNWSTSLGYGNLIINSLAGADSVTIFSTDANQSGFNLGGDANGEGLATILYDRSAGVLIFRNGSFPSADEAMRIDSGNRLLVGLTSSPTSVADSIACAGRIVTEATYNNTSSASANVVINSGGFLSRSTSSSRHKENIQDYEKGIEAVKALRPVTYESKNDDDNKTYAGFIAEEVHAAGLSEYVDYNTEGQPDALHYANMTAVLTKALQESLTKIESLEARVAALES